MLIPKAPRGKGQEELMHQAPCAAKDGECHLPTETATNIKKGNSRTWRKQILMPRKKTQNRHGTRVLTRRRMSDRLLNPRKSQHSSRHLRNYDRHNDGHLICKQIVQGRARRQKEGKTPTHSQHGVADLPAFQPLSTSPVELAIAMFFIFFMWSTVTMLKIPVEWTKISISWRPSRTHRCTTAWCRWDGIAA